jgi:hypothetical protein
MLAPVRLQMPLEVDPSEALLRADLSLRQAGFRFLDREAGRHVYEGPQLNSSNENPLRGAGRVELRAGGGMLEATADLAGTRWLMAFVLFFPPLLVGGLGLVSSRTMVDFDWVSLGPHGIWLVLGPLMAVWLRRRTLRAFEVFAESPVRQ